MTEESLFHEALAQSNESARAEFLDQSCAGKPELRAAVEALLAAHQASGSFLNKPPAKIGETSDSGPSAARPDTTSECSPSLSAGSLQVALTAEYRAKLAAGTVIANRYTLLEQIGEGGMGDVWVAKQTEPVKRKVALKVIKPGMDSRAVMARFEQERQALAILDHPNIAKVLDGGLTPDRQPFFVMEVVNGLPLTKFCDEARLTPRERLQLFVPICQAIQHAHQKGIIHRDLKPANILVTLIDGIPVPKVIDFGVAKAIAGKLTDESMSTQFGAVIGTLEYMSPEQAGFSGIDIDTRADIYSLGVILYELLTGLRPIDAKRLKEAAMAEMIRIIQEEEPSKPSTRLSTDESLPSLAAVRHTEPKRLMAMLRGDLDWVVMKCLEKQRERRYETANGLARDVQRYLDGDPVEACPPSASYRLRKFASKHRVGLATAAGITALLAVATAFSTWQAVRATSAERRARNEATRATDEADRAIRAEGQIRAERDRALNAETQARTEADKAKAIIDFLTTDLLTQAEPANNAAENHVTLLEVLDRAAEKVGGRFAGQPEVEVELRSAIASTYHGLASWEKAERQTLAMQELARRPGADPAEMYLAEMELAHVRRHQGRVDEATLDMARSAAEGLTRVRGPDNRDTLISRSFLAAAYSAAGHYAEAIALIEAIVKHNELKLGPDHPDTLTTRSNLAAAYRAAGRTAEATALLESTRNQLELKLGPDHPDTLTTRSNLASAYYAAGRTAEAISLIEATLRQTESKFGPDHPDTLSSRNDLAAAYLAAGRTAEAIPLFEETLKQREPKLGPDHPQTLTSRNNLAEAYLAAGRYAEAIALHEATLKLLKSKLGPDHPNTLSTSSNLAEAYRATRRTAEAIALHEATLKQRESKLGTDHPDTLASRNNLASAYRNVGRTAEAIALHETTLKQRESKLGPDHPDTLASRHNLASAYRSVGRIDEAIALWEKILPAARRVLGPQHPNTLKASGTLASSYESLGRWTLAEPLRRMVLAQRRATPGPDSPVVAGDIAALGMNLLRQGRYSDAEPVLRECLAILEKALPDNWETFNTKSMLGGALLRQKKYAEAEPLLLQGYEGLKQRAKTIPSAPNPRLKEALERVVQLCEAIGKKDEAAKWRKELETATAEQPPGARK
jgi:eukaryotic-like serine/threonine-protein kinase